jgi:carboxyl-terminal processing protease
MIRKGLRRFDRIPSRKSALFGLALRFAFRDRSIAIFTEGLGLQKFHGRAVLLVNQHTASAAEMIAGFVKENHPATIVGTRTAGQVLGGKVFKVGYGYLLGIPVTNYLTWNETALEGSRMS